MSLSTKLKENTKSAHTATEEATFNKDLMKGTLPLSKYGMFLKMLCVALSPLETKMKNSESSTIIKLRELTEEKTNLLVKDIECSQLQCRSISGDFASLAISIGDELRDMSSNKLIGAIYVFEGSALGGKFIKKALEQRLDNGEGVNYLSVYGNSVRTHWKNIQEALDSFVLTEDEEKEVIAAADRTFEMIEEIQSFIYQKEDLTHEL